MILPVCRLAAATGALLALSACERRTVDVYTAPKDTPPAPATAGLPPGHSHDDGHDHGPAPQAAARPELPKIGYVRPDGWQEAPGGQMSAVGFAIKGQGGEASVTITPLPNLEGKEELVVNMWRQQVGQEPLSGEAVKQSLTDVEIAGGKGQLFEISGSRDGKTHQIVTAMQHGQGGASWFYKLAGDEAVVQAQKPAFIEFLKTVRFEGSAPTAAAQAPGAQAESLAAATPAGAPPAEPAQAFKWAVPEGWQTVPAGQMQVAKFSVPEQNGAKADVAVSIFPNDTGGMLANVNRWLGQLGQQPVEEARLADFVKPIEGGPGGAQLMELPGDQRRIIGAVVPRDGRYFFYKMMGDTPAVNAARDAFVTFAKAQP